MIFLQLFCSKAFLGTVFFFGTQGSLEGSNVEIVQEMVDMITAWVTRNSQLASAEKNTHQPSPVKNTTANTRVATLTSSLS